MNQKPIQFRLLTLPLMFNEMTAQVSLLVLGRISRIVWSENHVCSVKSGCRGSHHAVDVIYAQHKSFRVKPIICVWSVTEASRKLCVYRIGFNHTDLHRNWYWLRRKATQLPHIENSSFRQNSTGEMKSWFCGSVSSVSIPPAEQSHPGVRISRLSWCHTKQSGLKRTGFQTFPFSLCQVFFHRSKADCCSCSTWLWLIWADWHHPH